MSSHQISNEVNNMLSNTLATNEDVPIVECPQVFEQSPIQPSLRRNHNNHNSELQDFSMSATGLYRNGCMLKQIAEVVSKGNAPEGTLINTKKKWNYIHLQRMIINDGERDQYGSNSS